MKTHSHGDEENSDWNYYPTIHTPEEIDALFERQRKDDEKRAQTHFFGQDMLAFEEWVWDNWNPPFRFGSGDIKYMFHAAREKGREKLAHAKACGRVKSWDCKEFYHIYAYDIIVSALGDLPVEERFPAFKERVNEFVEQATNEMIADLGEFRELRFLPREKLIEELVKTGRSVQRTFHYMKGSDDIAFMLFKMANGHLRGRVMEAELVELIDGKRVFEIREMIKPYL